MVNEEIANERTYINAIGKSATNLLLVNMKLPKKQQTVRLQRICNEIAT
jgi:hypothetical protein